MAHISGGDAGNLFQDQFNEEKYEDPVQEEMPPLQPKVVEMPVDDKGEIIREEVKKPQYGLDANMGEEAGATGIVKPPQEEESKFVVAEGATKRRFTAASQKIFASSALKRKDVLLEKECEVMAEIVTFVKAAHVTYTVKGFDRKGEFQAFRRYSEFHSLHQALCNRFPGLYIPGIPPKKAMGNTDMAFIIERRYFLDRFLSLVCEIDYLAFSQEFKAFLRIPGDFDKALGQIPKPNYEAIAEKYKELFSMEGVDEAELERATDEIANFTAFIKKAQSFLEALKNKVKGMIQPKDIENQNYGVFCTMLGKYEESALNEYCNSSDGHFIIKGSKAEQGFEDLQKQLKNPFKEVWYWLKGECLDCEAILDMIKNREKLLDSRVKSEKKKNDDRTALEKLQSGRKSLKTLFSTKSNADHMNNYANNISKVSEGQQQHERDIDALDVINYIVAVHLAKTVIPKLKRDKMQAYYKIVKKFSSVQSEQASTLSEIWAGILTSPNLKSL